MIQIRLLFISFLVLFLCAPLLSSEQSGTEVRHLQELTQPHLLAAGPSDLYILQKNGRILRYDLKTWQCRGTFSKIGSAPGEIQMLAGTLAAFQDKVYVGNEHQGALFASDGKLLRCLRPPFTGVLRPLGNRFTIGRIDLSRIKDGLRKYRIELLGPDLKKSRTIHQWEEREGESGIIMMIGQGGVSVKSRNGGGIRLNMGLTWPIAYGEDKMITVTEARGGTEFRIFNSEGLLESSFTFNLPKRPLTEADRKQLRNDFIARYESLKQHDPNWKKAFEKVSFIYPETYGGMDRIHLSDGLVYIRTFNYRRNEVEYLVLEPDGRLKKKIFLPQAEYWTIRNHRYYYLVDNVEEECWDLGIVEI